MPPTHTYYLLLLLLLLLLVISVSTLDVVQAALAAGSNALGSFNPQLLRLLRMFRIARLIRLIRSARGLRTLLHTVTGVAPALLNVCSLLGLVCLIYATFGMSLFGEIAPQPHLGYGGTAPSFETFSGAMQGHTWCTPTPCTFR